jgi:stearoyl-CoA desaturase (delta-9 desaturase)
MKKFQEVTPSRIYGYSWIVAGHVALAYLLITWQWKLLLISLLMHYLIMLFGLSLTYHRSVCHNAVKLPKAIEFIGLFLGGLAMQGSALSWAATHRQHHKHVGTEKDPHSPKHFGVLFIHIFGYAFSKIDPRLAANLFRTHHATWHKYYYWIYAPILLGSFVVLPFDLALAIFWAPIALVFQFENLSNTWAHSWSKDIPANVPLANMILGGEAWHKTHHDKAGLLRLHKYDILGYLAEKLFKK